MLGLYQGGLMMSISHIARAVTESPTLKLNGKAALLRSQGKPVIHLGGGEPKSKAPAEAIAAAAAHLSTGEIRYTATDGIPALKQAIIGYTERYYKRTVAPANVMASGGAKQAIMVALQSVLDPGDEVIFPSPYWVSYPEMVRLCGAVPVPVIPEDGTYYQHIRDIEKRVSPKTKAVIINSPNNPSGAMFSEQFISDIVDFCERREIYLIMDDIYHRLIFDGRLRLSCYDYVKDHSENSKLIVVNGVSKAYAMTGFRLGWAVASKKLIETMTNLQGHQTSGPSELSQKAAIGAINGSQACVDELCATLQSNRDVMMERLSGVDGITVTRPDGTFYCFADFSAFEPDSNKLSGFLIDKVMVLTVPGAEFGWEGYLRLSFCGSVQDITEGIERIKWALDPGSPGEIEIGGSAFVRDW
jgi:aspartate aminotransferase